MIDQSRLSGGFVKKCNYSPKAGVLKKWFINYDDIDRINTKLTNKLTCIEELILKPEAVMYEVYATKKASCNHQIITSDAGNYYKHSDTLVILHRDASSRERIQELVNGGRICVLIERLDQENKMEFLGYHSGMIITSDDYNTHDNKATSTITIASPEGEEEPTAIKLVTQGNPSPRIREFTYEFTLEFT